MQFIPSEDHHRRAQRFEMICVANELYGVAEPLFRPQQDCLAAQILAGPLRLDEVRTSGKVGLLDPPELELPKAFGDSLGRKKRKRVMRMKTDAWISEELLFKQVNDTSSLARAQ